MATVKLDFSKTVGKIKPMHAVNNGPMTENKGNPENSTFAAYKAAHIPFARTHDASIYYAWGGSHIVDVHCIFTDFNKNPYDERSYDFALTDDYLQNIVNAGTGVFYRLGTSIEHWRKKYGTVVPADFHKWAVICEHIIRHYNEGWADGFHFGIKYWEIWNEPDGVKPNGDQPNWSGTPQEYYELYEETATHLKSRFPDIKVGGPAISWVFQPTWFDDFLAYLTRDKKRVPLDFFSWHTYLSDPYKIKRFGEYVREKLDNAGYTETENILDEYNYLLNWSDKYIASVKGIIGITGAACTAACMSVGQDCCIDMLMYYDARPCGFNGLFDFYTCETLKGYYPFVYFSKLYELENQAQSSSDDEEIHVTAARNANDKAAMITYYTPEGKEEKEVEINVGIDGEWKMRMIDEDSKDCAKTVFAQNGKISMKMKPYTVVLIEKQD